LSKSGTDHNKSASLITLHHNLLPRCYRTGQLRPIWPHVWCFLFCGFRWV